MICTLKIKIAYNLGHMVFRVFLFGSLPWWCIPDSNVSQVTVIVIFESHFIFS